MRAASAIDAAERLVMRSRRELRDELRRLRTRQARPSFLAAAALGGALLGLALARRGAFGAAAGLIASAFIRRGVKYLVARAGIPM